MVFALGIFLIGGVGFVVDGANLWFHHQNAQTAADAACDAAAMDALSAAASVAPRPTWIPATADNSSFDCNGASVDLPPCRYAAFNGYPGSGSQVLHLSFPRKSNLPSNFSSLPDCPDNAPYTDNVCSADISDNGVASTPYIKVDLTENVPTTFMRLVGAPRTTPVPSHALCGLSNVLSQVPILVLNPNAPHGVDANNVTMSSTLQGTGKLSADYTVATTKDPTKLIQVNSSDPEAVTNLSGTILLTNADGSAGNFAVAGHSKPSSGGSYVQVNASGVMSDPFATVNAPPNQPSCPLGCATYGAPVGTPGCPANLSCDLYQPGFYPPIPCKDALNGQAAICVGSGADFPSNETGLAVFAPGIYYLGEDFYAGQNSCIRSVTGLSDGGGSVFYLSGKAVLDVTSNSGTLSRGSFNCVSTTVSTTDAACPGGDLGLTALGVTQLTGNVLLAPCTGPYGDPSGAGKVRGILFFQGRNLDVTPHAALWTGSSSFALVGNLYLHNCHLVSFGDNGANCDPSAFQQTLNIGSNGYIVGGIVVDQLAINSGADIHVILNPNPQYYVLKASLLQ